MKSTTIKIVAALVFAIFVAVLGAASWRGDSGNEGFNRRMSQQRFETGTRDEVIYEIERFYSVWRNYDTGTGSGKGAQGNS